MQAKFPSYPPLLMLLIFNFSTLLVYNNWLINIFMSILKKTGFGNRNLAINH